MTRLAPRATARALVLLAALALAGCGDDGGNDPPPLSRATAITATGAPAATVVNSLVTPAPAVRVTDVNGAGVEGVEVTFAVAGGGEVTGAVQRTDAQGIATVGSWRIGTTAGVGNALVASAGTLSARIDVVANPGPAASVTRAALYPEVQVTTPSSFVSMPPTVIVTDSYGNPVSGVQVLFTAAAGSGDVEGGLQVSNALGLATPTSWRVAATLGRQTMSALASGAASPITFGADVNASLPGTCGTPLPFQVHTIIGGGLATGDCTLDDGSFIDYYRFTTTSQVDVEIRQASDFDGFLTLASGSGTPIAADDDSYGTDPAIRLIAAPGTYQLGANAYDPGATGPYVITTSTAPPPAGCNRNTYLTKGVTTSQVIAASDCVATDATGTYYGDEFAVVVLAGQTVTITMRSSSVNAYLELYTPAAFVTADDNGAGGTDARITVTAQANTLFVIVASTFVTSTVGAYTLTVE